MLRPSMRREADSLATIGADENVRLVRLGCSLRTDPARLLDESPLLGGQSGHGHGGFSGSIRPEFTRERSCVQTAGFSPARLATKCSRIEKSGETRRSGTRSSGRSSSAFPSVFRWIRYDYLEDMYVASARQQGISLSSAILTRWKSLVRIQRRPFASPQSAQFSDVNPGTSAKSRTFRLMSVAVSARAILAIKMSPRPIRLSFLLAK
jgi:hypothetical protein